MPPACLFANSVASTAVLKQNSVCVTFAHCMCSQTNTKMIPNGYLMFEDENFIESSVAKLNALRKSGQFCDVRLQVPVPCPRGVPGGMWGLHQVKLLLHRLGDVRF